jgi:hypothetical protein
MIGRHASGRRLIPRSRENSTVTAYPGAGRAAQRCLGLSLSIAAAPAPARNRVDFD